MEGHRPPLTEKQLSCFKHMHTHTSLNKISCSSIIVWQSVTALSLCFQPFNLRTTLFLSGLTAFHWKKRPIYNKDKPMEKKMMWKADRSGLVSDHY